MLLLEIKLILQAEKVRYTIHTLHTSNILFR